MVLLHIRGIYLSIYLFLNFRDGMINTKGSMRLISQMRFVGVHPQPIAQGKFCGLRSMSITSLYRKRKIVDPNLENREVRQFVVYPNTVSISKTLAPKKDYINRKYEAYRVIVKGKLGTLHVDMPHGLDIRSTVCCEGFHNLEVIPLDLGLRSKGTRWISICRHLRNQIIGVSEGHYLYMELNGIGYKASLEGDKKIILKLGSPVQIKLMVPDLVDVKIIEPTLLVMRSIDLNLMTSFAGKIRKLKPPEPYKLKGIFVNGEVIKKKERKKT